MSPTIYCPVCQVNFKPQEEIKAGAVVICRVCGARMEILQAEPQIEARKLPQEPAQEIQDRVHTFAGLKGYVFNENKQLVIDGLLEKKEVYGDFYCPCRFDNVPENVCPCRETRQNQVKKEGQCL